jgi:hypothetical protein
MARLYINPTLEKAIRSYCELNEIDDINAFANRCALQGFNIIKFGVSPKDNIERENNGIKDIKKNASSSKKKKDSPPEDKGEHKEAESGRERHEEESVPTQETAAAKPITVRKIQIIKKQ